MKPILVYREPLMEPAELAVARRYFECTNSRIVGVDRLVIGRFSVVPNYDEMDRDVRLQGSRMVNSWRAHQYVADLGAYVEDLEDMTPKTWMDLSMVPKASAPYVLKGQTTSLKHLWPTHMFAATWQDAVQVYQRLQQDSLVSAQQIYIRKYVELETLWEAAGGMRITREHRIFVYRGRVLSRGFYWWPFRDDLEEAGVKIPDPYEVPQDWLGQAIARIGDRVPFYAIDVARDVTGRWWVVELNDGQQSGLSGNDPNVFYSALREEIGREIGS